MNYKDSKVLYYATKQASRDRSLDDLLAEPVTNGHTVDDDLMLDNDDDDDDDNVISLSKIKASVIDEDQKSISDSASEVRHEEKRVMPEVNLQEPFQPGSSPAHLLSRYMVNYIKSLIFKKIMLNMFEH